MSCEYFPKINQTFLSVFHANILTNCIDGINLYKFKSNQMYIPLNIVRYIGATTLHMLDLLHSHRIVYRDLKPDNLVVDFDDANIHLIDFGFAKIISDRTYTKCGSPGYFAPEVLHQKAEPQVNFFSQIR